MAQSPLILDNPIHDTVVILKAGPAQGQINVFTKPQGQANEAGVSKTFIDTSLTEAGKLPEPESFDVHYLQAIYLNVPEQDVEQIEALSYCVFQNAGNQIKAFQCTKTLITSGVGFPYTANPGLGTAAPANWGYPAPMAVYMLDHPILLGINETFQLQWKFQTVALSANVPVRVIIRGPHYMVDVIDQTTGVSTRRSR